MYSHSTERWRPAPQLGVPTHRHARHSPRGGMRALARPHLATKQGIDASNVFIVQKTSERTPLDSSARMLRRAYTGAWGAKVFWLALATLGPLAVRYSSNLLGLKVSISTIVYVAYHGLGIYLWLSVRTLFDPHAFDATERTGETRRLARFAGIHRTIGWLVGFLIALTIAAKLTLQIGGSQYRIPAPAFVEAVLGIDEPHHR
jgi:hypothetical protein